MLYFNVVEISGKYPSKEEAQRMETITWWKQIAQFAGKIVVFTVLNPTCYIVSRRVDKLWTMDVEPCQYFGFISIMSSDWQRGGEGFNMSRFNKAGAVPGNCALVDEFIAEADGLYMREATPEEIHFLKEAVAKKEAAFEYCNGWPIED